MTAAVLAAVIRTVPFSFSARPIVRSPTLLSADSASALKFSNARAARSCEPVRRAEPLLTMKRTQGCLLARNKPYVLLQAKELMQMLPLDLKDLKLIPARALRKTYDSVAPEPGVYMFFLKGGARGGQGIVQSAGQEHAP